VEVHPRPEEAFSDGGQSLKPARFAELVTQVRAIAEAIGRRVPPAPQPAPQVENARPAGLVDGGD